MKGSPSSRGCLLAFSAIWAQEISDIWGPELYIYRLQAEILVSASTPQYVVKLASIPAEIGGPLGCFSTAPLSWGHCHRNGNVQRFLIKPVDHPQGQRGHLPHTGSEDAQNLPLGKKFSMESDRSVIASIWGVLLPSVDISNVFLHVPMFLGHQQYLHFAVETHYQFVTLSVLSAPRLLGFHKFASPCFCSPSLSGSPYSGISGQGPEASADMASISQCPTDSPNMQTLHRFG